MMIGFDTMVEDLANCCLITTGVFAPCIICGDDCGMVFVMICCFGVVGTLTFITVLPAAGAGDVVRTCNFPFGNLINCWPGFRPRTMTLLSGPRMICTFCVLPPPDSDGVAGDETTVCFGCGAWIACWMTRVVPSGFLTTIFLCPMMCGLDESENV